MGRYLNPGDFNSRTYEFTLRRYAIHSAGIDGGLAFPKT